MLQNDSISLNKKLENAISEFDKTKEIKDDAEKSGARNTLNVLIEKTENQNSLIDSIKRLQKNNYDELRQLRQEKDSLSKQTSKKQLK